MGIVSLVNGRQHTVGTDTWNENLMFSQIRDAEIQLGVDVYKG